MITIEITDAATNQLERLTQQTGTEVFKITKEYT